MGSRPVRRRPADSNGCAAQVAARPTWVPVERILTGRMSSRRGRWPWSRELHCRDVDLLRRSWCRPWQPRSTRSSTSTRRIGGCVGSWSCRAVSRQTWSRPRTLSCLTQDRSAVALVQARVGREWRWSRGAPADVPDRYQLGPMLIIW